MAECSELGRTKGTDVGVILPSTSCQWHLRFRSFGTPSRVSRFFVLEPLNNYQYVVSHRPCHLVDSRQDLPHTYFFFTSTFTPARLFRRSWNLTCINSCYPSLPRPTLFFFPIRLCFQCYRTTENSWPPYRRSGDERATKRGIFSLFLFIFAFSFCFFSSIPIS